MVGIENEDSSSPNPPSYDLPAMPRLKHHSEYYSERGNFTVQVKDTVFKIWDEKFWTDSEFFTLVPQENGTTLENIANEKAELPPNPEGRTWKLNDVEVEDFTRLLWVINPRIPGKIKATTFEDWNGVLKLTDRWMFHTYFNHAVEKMSELSIDPIKKIQLMHRHKIRREWVIDAFVALTLRDTFPDQKDTEVLGLELTTYLAKARERVSYMVPFWNRRRYEPVKAVVCEVFRLSGGLKDPGSWKAT